MSHDLPVHRILHVSGLVWASLVAGALFYVLTEFARHPQWLLNVHAKGSFAKDLAFGFVLFYLTIPCVVVTIALLVRGHLPTLWPVAAYLSWLLLILLWWAWKSMVVYGQFPWRMFLHQLAWLSPGALAAGLIFGVLARYLR